MIAAPDTPPPTDIDILIVGSGPVGATYARCIAEDAPDLTILMVEAGPALATTPGAHVRSVNDIAQQARLRMLSQGPVSDVPPDDMSWPGRGSARARYRARPGTFLLAPDAASPMPAAAMSSCVGGMGVHWTCAVPRPRASEIPSFIPTDEMERALERAELLVGASPNLFGRDRGGDPLLAALAAALGDDLPADADVRPMPIAGEIGADGAIAWSSTATILGPLAAMPAPRFQLVSDTICMQILTAQGMATGAVLRHRVTGETQQVRASVVIVAADGLRTPQLLHASGIRPWALGRYLNDHTMVSATVGLHAHLIVSGKDSGTVLPGAPYDWLPGTRGAFWVPFAGAAHPFSGQIMDYALAGADGAPERRLAGVTWFGAKDIRAADRIDFSSTATDYLGLPAMSISYGYSELDQSCIDTMHAHVHRASTAIGRFIDGEVPTLRPAGASLHYQGAVRMGATDDGTSVCDGHARVWGSPNIFVGGNGVIPTATACNPTLTSMALAVRAASAVIEQVRRTEPTVRRDVA